MSKQIEERVVSLQFNNANFEKNVNQSMSTLEKLKEKLSFKGVAKGFDNISNAAKNVNLNGLNSQVGTLKASFSALDVIGVTALSNITNSAINAGKNMVKALTIDPITDGFREYETQMNAVQTILANTQSKGTTLDDVTSALDELNEYADQTIYNFTEMTRNIGTFTAAGVDLDKSVTSIKGIANLAAVSGSTSLQASTAMYQLSQALAAGRVSLMDWNSVVNAGMGGELFQNALKRTATQMGKDVDGLIEKYGSFRESLTEGQWLTADVLTETLTQLSGAYTEADLIAQGYSEKQAKEIVELANTAVDAATKVKTFTQLIDTMKEAVGSGWAQTWQIIFGDFEEAKELWTGVSEFFTGEKGIITGISEARNKMLEGALGSKWSSFTEEINKAGLSTKEFQKALAETASTQGIDLNKLIKQYGSLEKAISKGGISADMIKKTLKNVSSTTKDAAKETENLNEKLKKFQKVVDDVWQGDYKNVDTGRIELLKKAGYDYKEVQDLVNKTVNGRKLTLEDLSEAQLKSVGYTDKEIESLKKLAAEAEKSGTSLNTLIDQITKPTGREMLFGTLSNMLSPFVTLVKSLGEAWNNAFPPEQKAAVLYNIISYLYEISKHFAVSSETADKLTRSLKGLFAIFDILTSIVGGGFRIAFTVAGKVLTTLLDALGFANVGILDITATIGDFLVKVRDWLEENSLLNKAIEVTVPLIVNLFKAVYNLVKALWEMPVVQGAVNSFLESLQNLASLADKFFGPAVKMVENFINKLAGIKNISFEDVVKEFNNLYESITKYFADADVQEIGKNLVEGIKIGIEKGVSALWTAVTNIGKGIIDKIKEVLGIHSPSTEGMSIGQYFIEGICLGLKNGLGFLADGAKAVFDTLMGIFSSISFGDVFILGSALSAILLLNKMSNILDKIASPFEGAGKVLESFGGVLDSVSKNIDARTKNLKSEYILNLAKALAILAGSLFLLSQADPLKLWNAAAVIVAIGGALLGMYKIADMIGSKAGKSLLSEGASVIKISAMMLGMATSLLIMASAVKKLAEIDMGAGIVAVTELVVLMTAMMGLMTLYGKFVTGKAAANIAKAGTTILLMSVSVSIMASVIKRIADIPAGDVDKGIMTIGKVGLLFAALIAVSSVAGKRADKAGAMILKMSVAIAALSLVMKLIGTMTDSDIAKGLSVITGIGVIFAGLTFISSVAGANANDAGKMIKKMAVAIGILALSMKLIATMSVGDIIKGGIVISGISGIFAGIVVLSSIAGEHASKAGNMFMKMGIAIGFLAVAMKILSGLSLGDIIKGQGVIVGVGLIFTAMTYISKFAGDNASKAGSMFMKMGVAIGLMAVAIKVLADVSLGDVMKGVAAVSAMMIVMGLVTAMSKLAGEHADKAGTMLMKMSLALLVIAGAVALLSLLDPKKIAIATGCITAIMGMFSLMVGMSSLLKGAKGITGPIIAMAGVITILSGVLYLLSGLPVESTIGTAKALSELILALSASVTILSFTKTITPMALGAIAALSLIVAGLAGILYLVQDMNPESTIATTEGLSKLILSLSGACVMLGVVGAFGPSAFIGIGALATLIAGIGGLLVAIGALVTYVPQVEEFLNKGIPVIENIAYALGSFFGHIIEGFATSVLDIIPSLGTKLAEFMTNAEPFFSGIKMVDEGTATSAKAMAQTILYITGASILDGITRFLGITGSMESFSSQLTAFGKAMVSFSKTVSGNIDENAVTAAANAGKTMAEMQKTLPGTGGVIQFFTGEKDLNLFSEQLINFGKAIVGFSKTVSAEGAINETAITAASNAGQIMLELQNSLPNTGGLIQFFTGQTDLGTFGENIKTFGQAIVEFSNTVAGNGTINSGAIEAAAAAGQIMAELANNLPTDSAWWEFWKSDTMSLSDFAADLPEFGAKMTEFSNSVSGVSAEKVTGITEATIELVDALKVISEAELSAGSVSGYVSAINMLANANVSKLIETFNSDKVNIADVGVKLADSIRDGISSKNDSLVTAATTLISNIKKAFEGKKSEFNTAGKTLMDNLAKGIESKERTISTAAGNAVKAAKNKIRDYYDDFKTAGSYLVSGFASGISSNTWKAEAEAEAMAAAADQAARKRLKVKSPSRVFKEIGGYVPQGFAQGISMFGRVVKQAAEGMGNTAISGTERAMNMISAAINSDIDIQPKIRPVVDLSDIRAGSKTINSLFSQSPNLDLAANVSGLSASISTHQNGGNDDVVSELRDLKRAMKNTRGDTYQINGITYDDGSNVADAVKTLVRAARVERRK